MLLVFTVPHSHNPTGFSFQTTLDELYYIPNAKEPDATRYEDRIMLQTYCELLVWKPHAILKHMDDNCARVRPHVAARRSVNAVREFAGAKNLSCGAWDGPSQRLEWWW